MSPQPRSPDLWDTHILYLLCASVGAEGTLPTQCPYPAHSYVLTLITDGMRSVRAFHFDKAAASVLTTSVSRARVGSALGPGLVVPLFTSLPQMVTMEPGYLFLGSRLGNSLLLKYTEKLQEPPASSLREAADKVSTNNVGALSLACVRQPQG